MLAVDVGNSNTTFCLIENGIAQKLHCFETSDTITGKDMLDRLKTIYSDTDMITPIGLSCVVPSAVKLWKEAARKLSVPLNNIDELDSFPLTLKADPDVKIGADYLADMYGAYKLKGAPVIVVDLGTATNIGVLNDEGAFIGGSISPGVMLSAKALFAKAALLEDVELDSSRKAIGSNTQECLNIGIVTGNACMIEGLVQHMKDELKSPNCPVIATGGLAPLIAEQTTCFNEIVPELTLLGIYHLIEDA